MRRPCFHSSRSRNYDRAQLFNAERLLIDGSLTLFSSSSYVGGSQPAASGELHPRPAVVPAACAPGTATPPADTRRVLCLRSLRSSGERLCLHVLSSFQRTGFPARPRLASISPSGEPYEINPLPSACQALFCDQKLLFSARIRYQRSVPGSLTGSRSTPRAASSNTREGFDFPEGRACLEGTADTRTYCRLRACRGVICGQKSCPRELGQFFRPPRPGHARSS
jgi:hypothetical protein